jgi:hypothetical protein
MGRRASVSQGWIDVRKPVSRACTLVLKEPISFSATLAELTPAWPVGAIVRNPLDALVSWNRVTFALSDGRSMLVEGFHPALARDLDRLPDRHDRQIRLIHWFFEELATRLRPDRVVRYEEIVASRGAALGRLVPAAAALDVEITPRYHEDAADLMLDLGERLLRSDGGAWNVYDRADVERAMNRAAAFGVTPVRRGLQSVQPAGVACGLPVNAGIQARIAGYGG